MIDLEIPGYKHLRLEHLVLDVNGTIAFDGKLLVGVQPRLQKLQQLLNIHLLTADTHGKQASIDTILGLKAHIITQGTAEKADYVQALGAENVVTMGNGANDVAMSECAGLSIAVLGQEGAAGVLIRTADVLVRDIGDGLDLLLFPQRLRATLRR